MRAGLPRDGQATRSAANHPSLSIRPSRRLRLLLAVLMLPTGAMGQAGHAWAHGEGAAHQHSGQDGLTADHAHGVAFLLPCVSGVALPAPGAAPASSLSPRLAGALFDNPDRLPRVAAALA